MTWGSYTPSQFIIQHHRNHSSKDGMNPLRLAALGTPLYSSSERGRASGRFAKRGGVGAVREPPLRFR